MEKKIDVNLLVIFNTVMIMGSINKSADFLGMTNSAVSQAITRLKQHFTDPLFIKEGRGIRPTLFALEMHRDVAKALELLDNAITPRKEFDPVSSHRKFYITGEAYVEQLLMPELLNLFNQDAPHCLLDIYYSDDKAEVISNQLAERRADLFLTRQQLDHVSIVQEKLCQFESVVVAGNAHPRLGKSLLKKQFFDESHVVFKSKERHKTLLTSTVRHNIPKRNIAYESASIYQLLDIVENSDHLFICPTYLYEKYSSRFKIKAFPIPFETDPIPLYLSYHQSKRGDSSITWLTNKVKMVMRNINK